MAELRLGNIKPVGADNIVVEGKYVKGGYLVVATKNELFADPTIENSPNIKGKNGENIVEGSLCYCQEDSKLYQYNGTTWAEKEFGTKAEATTTTPGLMSKDDKKKLDNISAGAEVNVQADWNETNNSSDAYIKNKPSIINNLESDSTTDALSAAMGKALQMTIDNITTDLEDKGAGDMLKAVYVKGDANNTNKVDKAINAEQLGGVAASSYALKSAIPVVNDATLTIQKNGTNVTTFTANSATNATANITVPTKTSDLINDSGFKKITISQDDPEDGVTGDIWFKY